MCEHPSEIISAVGKFEFYLNLFEVISITFRTNNAQDFQDCPRKHDFLHSIQRNMINIATIVRKYGRFHSVSYKIHTNTMRENVCFI